MVVLYQLNCQRVVFIFVILILTILTTNIRINLILIMVSIIINHHHHHQPILSPRWFSRCLERSTFFFHPRNGLPVGGIVTTQRCTGAVHMILNAINRIVL